MESWRHWAVDTAERAAFTFVEAFIGLLILGQSEALGSSLSPDALQSALASGLISALAVVKAAIASRRAGLSPASLAGSGD